MALTNLHENIFIKFIEKERLIEGCWAISDEIINEIKVYFLPPEAKIDTLKVHSIEHKTIAGGIVVFYKVSFELEQE